MYKYLIACMALIACNNANDNKAQDATQPKIPFRYLSLWETQNDGVKKITATEYLKLDANGVSIGASDNPIKQKVDSFDTLGYLVKRIVDGYFFEVRPRISSHLIVKRTIDTILTEIVYIDDTLKEKYEAIPTGPYTYTAQYYYPINGSLVHTLTAYITVDNKYRQSKSKYLNYSDNDTAITEVNTIYPNDEYTVVETIVDGKTVQSDTTYSPTPMQKNTRGKAIVEKRYEQLQNYLDTTYHNISYEYY